MTVKIAMRRYGYRGWIWTEYDPDTDEMVEYRTDDRGEGLWRWQPTEYTLLTKGAYDPMGAPTMEWARIKSKYDYSLPYRRGSAWAKIRRSKKE
jgi:hypothetical protein